MSNKNRYDWVQGDLLKVTREHTLEKGNSEGIWPDVFLSKNISSDDPKLQIARDTVVIALDPCPASGQRAFVRVIHEDGVWVANSNCVARTYLENRF